MRRTVGWGVEFMASSGAEGQSQGRIGRERGVVVFRVESVQLPPQPSCRSRMLLVSWSPGVDSRYGIVAAGADGTDAIARHCYP